MKFLTFHSKHFFDKIKYKEDSILDRTNVYVSGTRCPTAWEKKIRSGKLFFILFYAKTA